MNTQHLQYLIEIERTRSVSQAAENLFIGQPNLSRILHEMEANLGFKIFERTSKGVRSTERGAIFLQHAKSIIRELERIDALGPRHPVENRLRICIPRAAFILDLTADYLNTLPVDQNLDSVVRECHARQAIEMLENGEVEVGIIRFRSEYRDYFEEQSVSRGFGFQILSRYRYQLLLPKTHALAEKQLITGQDLAGLPEIVHGDTFRKGPKVAVDGVARCARNVGDNHAFLAQNAVEKARLADVRLADDRNLDHVLVVFLVVRVREVFHTGVQNIARAVPMDRGNLNRVSETEVRMMASCSRP